MSAAPARSSAEQAKPPAGRPFWRDPLEPYARPDRGRGLRFLLTSVRPYLMLFALIDLSLRNSYLLALALAIPAAGFLVRVYIIFHDCTHGSFLASKRANRLTVEW